MIINGNNIEAIIFDLGGVILNIDLNGPFEKLKKLLGIDTKHDGLNIIKNNPVFLTFETGQISPQQFRDELRKISSNVFSNTEFDEIWNSIILDYPESNIRFLEKIKPLYRTFLMSNTNEIHYHFYSNSLEQKFGHKNLDSLFEKAYYSHISGMRKPDIIFYDYILSQNGLNPQNTLFIDDFKENIEAANQLGINTIHLINGMKISDIKLV